ncbi:rod shape-determining protein MreD [Aestuariicoccus sp. MJ-SS9]|uniref:rod shape-determining protein MreD n=1 Tax=Aestuariicoccus sp. MJ-SS9 TaxID=3079855 RepID=UPI002915AACA|nr:rod shape-determining protein MreD [Aestuariicoccus sp. MJ-SS9]MDU8909881.1 rod shape-determining protein MreD [Aestuariicoccus sp. MJ-SS9]
MGETPVLRLWLMRFAFVALALVIMFFHLIPLETVPRRWASPDLLVAFCFAWALRRPEYVPAISIAGIMLLADMLFQRPPGLWSALTLIAVELLKSGVGRQRENTFLLEWMSVAGTLLLITLIYRFVLAVLMVSEGAMWLGMVQYSMTILLYPVVVLVSQLVFGIRRPAPGDLERRGKVA